MDDRPGQSMAWRVQAADTVAFSGPQQCRRRPTAAGEAAGRGMASPRPCFGSAGHGFGGCAAWALARRRSRRIAARSPAQRPTGRRRCRPARPAAPISAPTGRAPKVAVRITADTRPSMALGVTAWRSVVVAMVQRMGPAPNRKRARPARARRARVSSIRALASSAQRAGGDQRAEAQPARQARRQQRAGQHAQAIDPQRQAHAGGVQPRSRMA